jgi:hypothetical protein
VVADGRWSAAPRGAPHGDVGHSRHDLRWQRTPLVSWFAAVWYVVNQRQGVSALGLQRGVGLGSYQTAWAWLHKLRRAMVLPGREPLSGAVEVDECDIGQGSGARGAVGNAIVVIAVEERGQARGGCGYGGSRTSPRTR